MQVGRGNVGLVYISIKYVCAEDGIIHAWIYIMG